MPKTVVLFSFLFPVPALAQFPAPESFAITVHYILEGQSDWCDGDIIQGPAYCNYFEWQAPDTMNTPATLTGYRIHKNDEVFLTTANTYADTAGGYLYTTFYVTAVYENPSGESEPSNSVYIEDLPIGVDEVFSQAPIDIWFDPVQQALIIRGAERAQAMWVYDLQGRLVLFADVVRVEQRVDGLAAGVYAVVVQDKYGAVHSEFVGIVGN